MTKTQGRDGHGAAPPVGHGHRHRDPTDTAGRLVAHTTSTSLLVTTR